MGFVVDFVLLEKKKYPFVSFFLPFFGFELLSFFYNEIKKKVIEFLALPP